MSIALQISCNLFFLFSSIEQNPYEGKRRLMAGKSALRSYLTFLTLTEIFFQIFSQKPTLGTSVAKFSPVLSFGKNDSARSFDIKD